MTESQTLPGLEVEMVGFAEFDLKGQRGSAAASKKLGGVCGLFAHFGGRDSLLPCYFRDTRCMVAITRQDKEVVREPIEKRDDINESLRLLVLGGIT